MITRQDIVDAIAEIEPNVKSYTDCQKLAVFKTLLNSYDNPTTPEGALRYWYTRLDRARNVLKKRPTYFYEMVQKQFQLTDEQMLLYFGPKPPLPEDADADYIEGERWK